MVIDAKIQDLYNPNYPLKNLYTDLYTRLKKCADYATAAGDTFNKEYLVQITYIIVAEM